MSVERQKQLSQALEHILKTLTMRYQPQKVILFGSMAHGSVSAWSDLDLVIIKDTSLPFLKRLT